MQSTAPLSEPCAESAPEARRMPLALLVGIALAQLLAFWLLCSHQVRKAEVRQAEVQVHRMALSDCLEYIPGSTIASCSRQLQATLASRPAPAVAPTAGTVAEATPVSYTVR